MSELSEVIDINNDKQLEKLYNSYVKFADVIAQLKYVREFISEYDRELDSVEAIDLIKEIMLVDVQKQYEEIDDINDELTEAFNRLKEELPGIEFPHIYTQVGSFDQSVIVGDHSLGISLDKYLGSDYPFYLGNYTVC